MKKTVDVCIVGGAGAGLTAAIYARQNGAEKVLILERMSKPGGTTQIAGGMFAVDSPVQKRAGLFYDVDQVYNDLMQVLNWNVDALLVRKWITGCGETIRWLEELGIRFQGVSPFSGLNDGSIRKTYHRGNNPHGKGLPFIGRDIVLALEKRCDELGVEIVTNARAKRLVKNEDNAVCGVVAELKDGETLEVDAKAVLLATGTISNNDELIRRMYGHDDFLSMKIMARIPHNTGDGHLMAEEAGVALGRMSTLFIGPHNHFPGASEVTQALMRRPQLMKVNKMGERCFNEGWAFDNEFGWMGAASLSVQPGKMIYCIFDQSIKRAMQENPENYNLVDNPYLGKYDYENENQWLEDIDRDMASEEKAGRAKICQTLEEVAEFIGCDYDVFKASFDRYNTFCKNKYDGDFLKSPRWLLPLTEAPYYVIQGPCGIDTCMGGIIIDNHQRTLDKDGMPVKGLYAAGVCTSCWLAGLYAFFGSELSYTLFSGRNAGQEMAQYVASLDRK